MVARLHAFLLPLPIRLDVRRVFIVGRGGGGQSKLLQVGGLEPNSFVCKLTLVGMPAPHASCLAARLGCWGCSGAEQLRQVRGSCPNSFTPRSLAAGCQDTSWDYQRQTRVYVACAMGSRMSLGQLTLITGPWK